MKILVFCLAVSILCTSCSKVVNIEPPSSSGAVSVVKSSSASSILDPDEFSSYESPLGVSIKYPKYIYSGEYYDQKQVVVIHEFQSGFQIGTKKNEYDFWKIYINNAKNEAEIQDALQAIDWLKNCPVKIGPFDYNDTANVEIIRTVSGIDEYKDGECYSFAAYKILFNRKLEKVAFWVIGQEALYYALGGYSGKGTYDGQMIESFKFIEN